MDLHSGIVKRIKSVCIITRRNFDMTRHLRKGHDRRYSEHIPLTSMTYYTSIALLAACTQTKIYPPITLVPG